MALFLPHGNALILEIPKTGTTWIRVALEQLKIPHRKAAVRKRGCPRHSPPGYYAPAAFTAAIVRHPQSYLESFWRFTYRSPHPIRPDLHYPQRTLREAIRPVFADYARAIVEKHPGEISRLFEEYCGPPESPRVQFVGRQETLEESLAEILEHCGRKVHLARLRSIALQNVSRPAECRWPPDLLERFLAAEAPAIERWYGGR